MWTANDQVTQRRPLEVCGHLIAERPAATSPRLDTAYAVDEERLTLQWLESLASTCGSETPQRKVNTMQTKQARFRFTLNLTAGDAAIPDIGKVLGQTGANLVEVKRTYDTATAAQRGDVVPVVVTVYEDRSFELHYKTPPTAFLIRKALGRAGSSRPGHDGAGRLSREQVREIALRKLPDLNTTDLGAAMRTVAGTARSMGVTAEV